jgi:excisionase family DNA binding protein
MLTLAEVARYLRKPNGWVYANWQSAGLPFKRIGNQLRMREAELEDWIDRQVS